MFQHVDKDNEELLCCFLAANWIQQGHLSSLTQLHGAQCLWRLPVPSQNAL